MKFPLERYNLNSIYSLSNGYYIDIISNPQTNNYSIISKTPEGARVIDQITAGQIENYPNLILKNGTSPIQIRQSLDSEISFLSQFLNVDNLSIIEIIKKQTPPLPKKNSQFKIIGRVVTVDGDPITRSQIKPTFISFPKPPPIPFDAQSPSVGLEVNLLGTAIVVPPVGVDDGGNFTIEYFGEEEIDFKTSYIEITANSFFPKTIGPKLIKTGEQTLTKKSLSTSFKTSLSEKDLKLSQQENGNYKAVITLENRNTGQIVTAEGISLNRETAKNIARSNAEKKFTDLNSEAEVEVIDVYDVGRIVLDPTELNLEKEEAKILQQVQEIENFEIEIAGKRGLPFEVKLTNIFNKQKENLKRTLFPAILVIIAKFGPNIVHSILSGKINPLEDKVCPSKEELQNAINKRNQLVRQLNNIYKIVRTIAKVLKVTNALVLGLKIGLTIAQVLSAIPTTPFTPFGLKPFYSGLTEKAFKTIDKRLEIAGIAVTILTIVAATIGATLAAIIRLLESLDFMIQDCAQQINEQGEFTLSFVEINNELNSFVDPTTGQIDSTIDPLTGEPLPYKGFTFEIKVDTSQDFQYPKRYAIARNIQGIQVLRSESSFASNPDVLIEELKFIIDRDNLRAD